ncbi:MAG: hypothetical protein NTY19_16930 [Planctomycetota bacterium]|nr:hypothetical protein [Planctomycetota bacterium]
MSQRKVQGLSFDQNWAEVGQKLSGQVQLSGEGRADQPLVVSLLDRRGREIVRQIAKADATEQAFSFDVQPWFPMLRDSRSSSCP